MTNNFKICLRKRIVLAAFLLVCCFVLLVSCDNSYDNDGKHPFFVKAENFYNNGKYDESISLYQKYLDINPKSPKANYRLANIFQQKEDYIRAVFYYEKYLTLNPNNSDREVIEKWIQASKESLAKQLVELYPASSRINADKTEMLTLKKENEQLQSLILQQKEPKPQTSVLELATNNIKNEKQSLPVKYYTVQEGDNFQKISRRFYGSSKYYKQIIDANKDTLKGSTVLRIGNKIIIPLLKKDTTLKKEN